MQVVAAVEKRRGLASIPVEKVELWRSFCARWNIDRAPFCEVLADWLAENQDDPPAFVVELIAEAAALMTERRARD